MLRHLHGICQYFGHAQVLVLNRGQHCLVDEVKEGEEGHITGVASPLEHRQRDRLKAAEVFDVRTHKEQLVLIDSQSIKDFCPSYFELGVLELIPSENVQEQLFVLLLLDEVNELLEVFLPVI